MSKIGIIIQARTSSSRLPRKVLKELPYGSGITVLEQVIRRAKRSRRSDVVIVATTEEKGDDPIVAIAQKEKVMYFRGSKEDVLARYYFAARANKLDAIVRLTSDNPCVDPRLIDSMISRHCRVACDFSYNQDCPCGLGVEVISRAALEQAFLKARKDCEREHVTVYIYQSHPERFAIGRVKTSRPFRRPELRLTLDTHEDYVLLCAVYDWLYPKDRFFGAGQIIRLFNRHPWLSLINGRSYQKRVFSTAKEELGEAEKVLGLYGFHRALKIVKDARP